ncbi:hypothetical protein BJF90_06335 [Pseudonocardia sp. CNS-004]|nr:hypothetical protein BJF90_06335 [Pseudonocardia sp. CNS-004]
MEDGIDSAHRLVQAPGVPQVAADGLALYEKFMRPRALEDELRAVMRVDGRPWGMLSLFRARGRRSFDNDDTALLGRLSGPLAQRLRSYAQPPSPSTAGSTTGPGLLVFDPDATLVSINTTARRLLAEMPAGAAVPACATRTVESPRRRW